MFEKCNFLSLHTTICFQAEKELYDIHGNPYYLTPDAVDDLNTEIEELKIFASEVKKILGERRSARGPIDDGQV